MTELTGKAIIVTGAASGMGLACVRGAIAAGARVLLVDRDAALLDAAGAETGGEIQVFDVTDVERAPHIVERCQTAFGRVDGLVNAAGITQTAGLLDITPADFDRVMGVNLRGSFFLLQAAARTLAAQGAGSIVNFASTAARAGRPFSSHYAASKAAVVNLTRSAAAALAPDGVRVNAVLPGLVETPMAAAIRDERTRVLGTDAATVLADWTRLIPMGRLGTPEEIAPLVTFLLSDAASYLTGEAIGVNGGADGS